MGWNESWETLRNWGSNLWNNTSVTNSTYAAFNFSYKTVEHLFSQASSLPKLVYSGITNQETRTVAYHMLRIGAEDLAPLVIVSHVSTSLQQYGQTLLEDNQSSGSLNADLLIHTSLLLLNSAATIYTSRKRLQMSVRTATVNIEATKAFTESMPEIKLCKELNCGSLSFVKGAFRDFIAFQSTELLINSVNYIPYVGKPVASALSIYHHGRHILTLVLPLCNQHKEMYLNEHSELALAQGITHATTSYLANQLIESISGIPQRYYAPTIKQFLLLGQMAVVTHMDLPSSVSTSNRGQYDPLALYIKGIHSIMDIMLVGAKNQLPDLLKGKQLSALPWKKMSSVMTTLWKHPVNQTVRYIMLPSMLQSKQQLINDPIVGYHWKEIRSQAIFTLQTVEKVVNLYAVRLATTLPNATSETAWIFLGAPKEVTHLLLDILKNPAFLNEVGKLRRSLEGIHGGQAPVLSFTSPTTTSQTKSNKYLLSAHMKLIEQNSSNLKTDLPVTNTLKRRRLANKHHANLRSVNDTNSVRALLKPAGNQTLFSSRKKKHSDLTSILRPEKNNNISMNY